MIGIVKLTPEEDAAFTKADKDGGDFCALNILASDAELAGVGPRGEILLGCKMVIPAGVFPDQAAKSRLLDKDGNPTGLVRMVGEALAHAPMVRLIVRRDALSREARETLATISQEEENGQDRLR